MEQVGVEPGLLILRADFRNGAIVMKALELVSQTVRFSFEMRGVGRYGRCGGLACAGGDASDMCPEGAASENTARKISQASLGVILLICS